MIPLKHHQWSSANHLACNKTNEKHLEYIALFVMKHESILHIFSFIPSPPNDSSLETKFVTGVFWYLITNVMESYPTFLHAMVLYWFVNHLLGTYKVYC